MLLLKILITLSLIFFFNKIFFFLNKKMIFINYFKKFIFYTIINAIILISILTYYENNILFNKNDSIILISLIIIYFLFFFSFFLTIGLKSVNSPTYDIFNIIKNNRTNKETLIKEIKKINIINKRIKDLIKQGLVKKNDKLELTPLGLTTAKFFILIKKKFKLKSEG